MDRAANTTRFSTALACAAFMRIAHSAIGLGSSGYPTAPVTPRTMIRLRMYGIHITPVKVVTNARYINSVVIVNLPFRGRLEIM